VFSRQELELIASLCREHDAIAITDEVYERLVFEGAHIRLATLDGMSDRTVTLSSLGKTFSLTGWKIGWAIAPPHLTAGVRAAHQFLTFATATPLQHAAAVALRAPDSYYEDFVKSYRRRRDLLIDGLARIGFEVYPPQGTYRGRTSSWPTTHPSASRTMSPSAAISSSTSASAPSPRASSTSSPSTAGHWCALRSARTSRRWARRSAD
jgi:hypothetical protein